MRTEAARRIALAISLGCWLASSASPALAVCESPGDDIHASSDGHEGGGTGGTGLWPGDEGSGAGGTGLRPGDEGSGTGGTGVRVAESGSGTGGTGLRDADTGSGAGGTGILGTITGFGSICVNGLRVTYDATTPVERDGDELSPSSLAVGQVVRVATRPGPGLHAARIAVENALSGPVTRVALEQNRIWVMEQPVELPPDARVLARATAPGSDGQRGIETGNLVDVSGQRRSDGVVVATRVAARGADRPHSATGVAIAAVGRIAYLGDLRAELARDAGALASGDRVVLKGRWNARSHTLEGASLAEASPASGGVERLSLEGFVETAGPEGHFEVAGTALDTSALKGSLARGSLVRVHGRLDDRGRLRAERVQLRSRPGRAGADGIADRAGETRRDRSGRGERHGSDRGDRADRPERTDRPERPERPERYERPDRSGRPSRPGRD